jgi:Acyl-CoA carboxylase epsilon subunit
VTEHPAVPEGLAERPVLRVISGEATPEEIAAVVAAVAAAASPAAPSREGGQPEPRTASVWSLPGHAHRNVRATFAPGPDGWRTSFWPR